MKRKLLGAVALALILTACGGGSDGSSSGSPTSMAPTPSPIPTSTPPPTSTVTPATLTYAYYFGSSAGSQPNGPLLQASDGNFYGTTRAGGTSGCTVGCGVLFRLSPNGTATALHAFGDRPGDGERPTAPLIQGRDGALYGTTSYGGRYGAGTVYRIALDGTYAILYSFGATAADGSVPVSGLIQGSDGNFYGTTTVGGVNRCTNVPGTANNCGTVFRITPAGVETVLYSFGASTADGVQPEAPLVQGSDGNLYGTTVTGGSNTCSTTGAPNTCGTAYRVTLAGVETVLHSFGQGGSADGIAPQGPLIQAADGNFWGTTVSGGQGRCGGAFGCGTVYRMTASGTVTIAYAFALSSTTDGYGPSPLLTIGRDGNLYGTTGSGGALGGDLLGTAFRLTQAGAKTTLYSFGPYSSPTNPVGGLIQASDGAFWGLTFYGQNGLASGAVFRLAP